MVETGQTAQTSPHNPDPILLLVAGAKGAIATTLAVATIALQKQPELILPYLTIADRLSSPIRQINMAGWDTRSLSLTDGLKNHGVLSPSFWQPYADSFDRIDLRLPPEDSLDFNRRVKTIQDDITTFNKALPNNVPIFVNLLPAAADHDCGNLWDLDQLYKNGSENGCPDLAYVTAALLSHIPVINFTPNTVEIPVLCRLAEKNGIPIAGRDGKTGQTYFKVALASALKARNLSVDGWYSLNILGNSDGKNLMNPDRAAGKLSNKTELLNDILGYPVGVEYGGDTHKVHIDYYPPRGDAKEAWDVVDFKGLFGLPMSIRLNFQARDSILAAPMILDLAHWLVALKNAGRGGPISELGFYFKKPIGPHPPLTFQDQMGALNGLAKKLNDQLQGSP